MKSEFERQKLCLKSKFEPTKKEEKALSPYKRSKALQEAIRLRRNDMKLLIAVALGEKMLPAHSRSAGFWERTQADDRRFLRTLRQLREQIRCLEREALLLKEDRCD